VKIVFFSLNYKSFPIQSGFEQLSSLIRRRVLAIYKMFSFQAKLEFVGAEIFTNFCFFSIILATDMLESHSKALKTRIFA